MLTVDNLRGFSKIPDPNTHIYYKRHTIDGKRFYEVIDRLTEHREVMEAAMFEARYVTKREEESVPVGEPKFKAGDIVYIIPQPQVPPSRSFPSIGSSYEIDCKVLSYQLFKKAYVYEVITGNGQMLHSIAQKMLVISQDKYLYGGEEYKALKEDTELCPKGTVCSKLGDYYANEALGIGAVANGHQQLLPRLPRA